MDSWFFNSVCSVINSPFPLSPCWMPVTMPRQAWPFNLSNDSAISPTFASPLKWLFFKNWNGLSYQSQSLNCRFNLSHRYHRLGESPSTISLNFCLHPCDAISCYDLDNVEKCVGQKSPASTHLWRSQKMVWRRERLFWQSFFTWKTRNGFIEKRPVRILGMTSVSCEWIGLFR